MFDSIKGKWNAAKKKAADKKASKARVEAKIKAHQTETKSSPKKQVLTKKESGGLLGKAVSGLKDRKKQLEKAGR